MSLPGERLLLAATLDEVQEGELFDNLPPHMSLVRWSSIAEHRRAQVECGLNNIFSNQHVYQDVLGSVNDSYVIDGERVRVRLMKLKERDLKFRDAAHSLIKSLGRFDPEDRYADTKSFYEGHAKFRPLVKDTPERKIGHFESVSFQTVAMFALHADDPRHIHRVLSSYQLAHSEKEPT
ncbi:MAG: hypothetical protein EOT05_01655 [Candidatus Microsaccharimonas sossegonensis]|uniref:Uncharacterized protein n=1 Tax=Candidatus Microsaccharimonas sossegonensis TaxID=2506948 RepID=A0A4Q0AHG7_9BACT|nr:MAG: hypothetical protein EOT05_01655 [Candidatus Microsaccharimonas sossegonensis]